MSEVPGAEVSVSEEPVARGAIVEIIDPHDKGRGPLVPSRVRINGVDVGYTQGVTVEAGGKAEPARVTLILLPSQIIIRGEDA